MFLFLIPLLIGYIFNSASSFTTFYCHHFGERVGRSVTIFFRDAVGIPVWAIGYGMAAMASTPTLFEPTIIILLLAGILILAGAGIIIAGLFSIGWRAAAPSLQDNLVVNGLYAHIRHPLYSGMILELGGLFLCIPTLSMLVACLLGVLWILVQVRLEEMDLLERIPAYKEYKQHVPRFVPSKIISH
jgi:protein-S-isoprenylcysteine O-methyltransferase Ste14